MKFNLFLIGFPINRSNETQITIKKMVKTITITFVDKDNKKKIKRIIVDKNTKIELSVKKQRSRKRPFDNDLKVIQKIMSVKDSAETIDTLETLIDRLKLDLMMKETPDLLECYKYIEKMSSKKKEVDRKCSGEKQKQKKK